MNSKNILLGIVIVIIVGIGIYVVFALSNTDQNVSTVTDQSVRADVVDGSKTSEKIDVAQSVNGNNDAQTNSQTENMIKVSFPQPDDAIGSSLIVTGIARGNWFFEGDFPVRLKDANGNDITMASARAQGEWMTENFVPFIAELSFDPGDMKNATLVLERSNPSGMAENNTSMEIPVRIDAGKSTIKVFFSNDNMSANCNNVVATSRSIDKSNTQMERKALEDLLSGTTDRENALGYKTSINSGVTIKSLDINNGIAKVDLSEDVNKNVGGSCRVAAIRAQITETLKQFPTVNTVEISVNGNKNALQP